MKSERSIPCVYSLVVSVVTLVTVSFQRLALYTLACIMYNPSFPEETRQAKLSSTLEVLEGWNAWNDVSALAYHQTVRKYLLTCLKSVGKFPNTRADNPDVRHLHENTFFSRTNLHFQVD